MDCLSVCNQLKAASSCCERQLNESLADLDVSHCQVSILMKVCDAPLSMSELSKHLCCHKSNITQVVSGLLTKKLIQRTSLKTDKRVAKLSLTPKGKQACMKLERILSGRACDCMSVFTPAEKKVFSELLEKYIARHRG